MKSHFHEKKSLYILFNPRSGFGRSKALAEKLLKICSEKKIEAKAHTVFEYPEAYDDQIIILIGGDGSWHYLENLSQKRTSVYLVAKGSMNLLAHAMRLSPKPEAILASLTAKPIELLVHRLIGESYNQKASTNWSFGLDGFIMHKLSNKRHTRFSHIKAIFAAFWYKAPIQKVWVDGKYLGEFEGGFFSFLPCYAHRCIRLHTEKKWQWQGYLFKKQSVWTQVYHGLLSFIKPGAYHRGLLVCKGNKIKIEGAEKSPLQADGEACSFTPVEASVEKGNLESLGTS